MYKSQNVEIYLGTLFSKKKFSIKLTLVKNYIDEIN